MRDDGKRTKGGEEEEEGKRDGQLTSADVLIFNLDSGPAHGRQSHPRALYLPIQ